LIRKAQPVPTAAMVRPAMAGADHPGGVERGRVERHGVVQVGIADQFRDESLAHRRIESGGAAEQEGEDVNVPELDGAGDGQEPQDQGETAHGRLGGDEELALVEMVGGEAGPGQQQELRSELQGHDEADRRRVVIGELGEDQPVLAGPLHPGCRCWRRRLRLPRPDS